MCCSGRCLEVLDKNGGKQPFENARTSPDLSPQVLILLTSMREYCTTVLVPKDGRISSNRSPHWLRSTIEADIEVVKSYSYVHRPYRYSSRNAPSKSVHREGPPAATSSGVTVRIARYSTATNKKQCGCEPSQYPDHRAHSFRSFLGLYFY